MDRRAARPGEVSLHLAFGEGVQLTEEQEAAVSALLRSLEAVDAEVTGLAKCPEGGGLHEASPAIP